ncbi:hypothetical protein [Yoonia sp. SS1-5]|uniref:Uncharacterized protein n=1 Tax=Yoonia rhodophyticola TaxID=3137370 RepID=A0AAN0MCK2_9RHOB
MDDAERRAEQLLASFDIGTFAYEPLGQRSPDFGLDDRIAVEVTRLTKETNVEREHIIIDSDEVPIRQIVGTAISSFDGSACTRSAFVNYRFRRPLQRQDLRTTLRDFLDNALKHEIAETHPTQVCRGFWVDLKRGKHRPGRPFIEGASNDSDRSGWLVPDMLRNVSRIAAIKQNKAMDAQRQYLEWWLFLENRLSYRLDVEALSEFRATIRPNSFWTKCVAFDPRDPLQYEFLWDLSDQHIRT